MLRHRPSVVAAAILLTSGIVALVLGFRQVQRPVVILDVQSYTSGDNGLYSRVILSNCGPAEVKLDVFFHPTFRVRAQTSNGWTNYEIAEVIGGDFVPPGSNTTFSIFLPRGTHRWDITTYFLTIPPLRARAMRIIPWTPNTALNSRLFRLHFNRSAVQSKVFEVTWK
jgi:hypothetical protein